MSEEPMDEEFRDDPESRALAERLARTDFSPLSRTRSSLRARLIPRRAATRALALAFAAALVALVVPFVSRPPAPAYPRGPEGLPVLPGRLPAAGAGPSPLFETAQARVTEGPRGRVVAWSVGGSVFVLETRRVNFDIRKNEVIQ